MKRNKGIIPIIYWAIAVFYLTVVSSCNDHPYQKGERLYLAQCANCHMEDGSGLNKLIPSLHQLQQRSLSYQVCIIKNGYNADSLGQTMRVMPAFDKIKEPDLTNLINYINHSWNKGHKEVSLNEVKHEYSACK